MNFVTTNTLIPFAAFFVALLLLVILTGARKRTLAYFIAYLALPAWLGSWSALALALVLILIVMLLLYVKLI